MDAETVKAVWSGPERRNVKRVISKPEHLSGDFFRSDVELRDAKDARLKGAAEVKAKSQADAMVEAMVAKQGA